MIFCSDIFEQFNPGFQSLDKNIFQGVDLRELSNEIYKMICYYSGNEINGNTLIPQLGLYEGTMSNIVQDSGLKGKRLIFNNSTITINKEASGSETGPISWLFRFSVNSLSGNQYIFIDRGGSTENGLVFYIATDTINAVYRKNGGIIWQHAKKISAAIFYNVLITWNGLSGDNSVNFYLNNL
jgi:hypothetical protein